jgi:hypothetical protein
MLLAAGVGYYQANIFVADLFGDSFLDGSQQIQAEAGGGFEDLLLVDGMHPIRAEGRFAFFDEVGDEDDHRRNFSSAELGNLLKGAALIQQFQSFLRGA